MTEQNLHPNKRAPETAALEQRELQGVDSPLYTIPQILPPLDKGFRPCAVGNRAYRDLVRSADEPERVVIAIERENGLVARRELEVLPLGGRYDADTREYVERTVKFMLWANGGWKIQFSGPQPLGRLIAETYRLGGAREFDTKLMSGVYEKGQFEVELVTPDKVAVEKTNPVALGGHLDGCRIGFDLGASDVKVAAVQDGQVVFTTELPWDPKNAADPDYHEKFIRDALRLAASKLPRLDAIGGSSAGVIVDNRVRVASLFRSVSPEQFKARIVDLFVRFGQEFDVPLQVINDGDVTALAGGLSLNRRAVLGIAMGSSEAAGYLDPSGLITGYLNELAFAPVDYNRRAAADEWSGDRGVGVSYFSQQAVGKLLLESGIDLPEQMGLPVKLEQVQRLAEQGDSCADNIAKTIGVYLGYTIAHYADFYDFRDALILGRVTTGRMGGTIVDQARVVLRSEFPEVSEKVTLQTPDEKSKRVGQAVAAASLPEL